MSSHSNSVNRSYNSRSARSRNVSPAGSSVNSSGRSIQNFNFQNNNQNSDIPYTLIRISGRYYVRYGRNSALVRPLRLLSRENLIYVLHSLYYETGIHRNANINGTNNKNTLMTFLYPYLRAVMPGRANSSFGGVVTQALINSIP